MSNWIDLAAQDDVFDGAGLGLVVQGHDIALFRVGDAVFAIDNLCSHGNARLCEGFMDGHLVECPFHQALFDVRDGTVSCGPASEPVKSWPIKVENGRVWIDLAHSTGMPAL